MTISNPHHNSNNSLLQLKNCIAMIELPQNTNPYSWDKNGLTALTAKQAELSLGTDSSKKICCPMLV
jgi:hypothetical protein